MTTTCKLVCTDGEIVEVDVETARQSVLVSNFIDEQGTSTEMPLPSITKETLSKVILFCEHLREHIPIEIEQPLPSTNMSYVSDQWHADYINIETEALFDLVNAAQYLDIQPLMELACAKLASIV